MGPVVPTKRCDRCGLEQPVDAYYPKVSSRRRDGSQTTIRDRWCGRCRREQERAVQQQQRATRSSGRSLPSGTDFTLVAHAMIAPGVRYAALSRAQRGAVLVLGRELARRYASGSHPRLKPLPNDDATAAVLPILEAFASIDAVPFSAGHPKNKDHDPPMSGRTT